MKKREILKAIAMILCALIFIGLLMGLVVLPLLQTMF